MGSYPWSSGEGVQKGVERPWGKVIGEVVLGRERFVQSIRGRVGSGRDREVPSRRRPERRLTWEVIKKEVRKASPELKFLRTGNRSNPERAVVNYLGCERGGLSLKDLAKRCVPLN